MFKVWYYTQKLKDKESMPLGLKKIPSKVYKHQREQFTSL